MIVIVVTTMLRLKAIITGRDPIFVELARNDPLSKLKVIVAREKNIPLEQLVLAGEYAGREEVAVGTLKLTNNQPVFLSIVSEPKQSVIDEQLEMVERYEEEVTIDHIYLPIRIDGFEGKGCIDTGANGSVMSEEFARRVGLEGTIDRRITGQMKGVGQSAMVGRIHRCPVKLGTRLYLTMVDIIESFGVDEFDLLIGCDFLKRNRVVIDFENDVMKIGGETIFFGANAPKYVVPNFFGSDELSCNKLVELFNCDHWRAKQALERCGGNLEAAAELLISA